MNRTDTAKGHFPPIIGLMNAYTRGISGGDIWFIEVMKRFSHFEKTIMTSPSGAEEARKKGLIDCNYLVVGNDKFRNVLIEYLSRTYKAVGLLKKVEAQIIYSSSDFFPDVIPAVFYKRRKRQTVWVQKIYHLVPIRRFPAWVLQKISHYIIFWKADLIFVDSEELAGRLISFGLRSDRVKVCQPGVDKVDLAQTHSGKSARDKFDAVYLGRIHPAKGIEELVEIWSLVVKKVSGSKLVLVGYGEEKYVASILSLVRKKGLTGRISILGYLDDTSVSSLLESSRVFVTASREEGFGMALMEALVCGTPVVCWDIPAFRQAFGSLVGRVQIGEVSEFANQVVCLLTDDLVFESAVTVIGENANFTSWSYAANREQELIESLSK